MFVEALVEIKKKIGGILYTMFARCTIFERYFKDKTSTATMITNVLTLQ